MAPFPARRPAHGSPAGPEGQPGGAVPGPARPRVDRGAPAPSRSPRSARPFVAPDALRASDHRITAAMRCRPGDEAAGALPAPDSPHSVTAWAVVLSLIALRW